MFGRIYPGGYCKTCKARFQHTNFDPARMVFFCQNHPEQTARFYILRLGDQTLYFNDIVKATEARFEAHRRQLQEKEQARREGRPYRSPFKSAKGYSFEIWKTKYLEHRESLTREKERKDRLDIKQYNLECTWMEKLADYFKGRSVAEITGIEWRDAIDACFPDVCNRTKENRRSCVNTFLDFLVSEPVKVIAKVNRPEIEPYEFSKRPPKKQTLCEEHRQTILDEVAELTFDDNPKIYWAIFWHLEYNAFRTCEITRIAEGDIILNVEGKSYLNAWDGKERDWKPVPLDPNDVPILRQLQKQFPATSPDDPFFRHHNRAGKFRKLDGQAFTANMLQKRWKAAYDSLKRKHEIQSDDPFPIPWVPLNAAGRNTGTSRASRKFGRRQAKIASQHKTDSAFDRYDAEQDAERAEVYSFNRPQISPKVIQKIYKESGSLKKA